MRNRRKTDWKDNNNPGVCANEYENFVEINFILDKGADKIFEGKLDADTIIENLTAFKMQKLEPGKTLIFLDEVQECPNARCCHQISGGRREV